MKIDATAFVGELALIAALKKRSAPVDCGECRVLFRQGDEPTGMYIVHRGKVALTMHSPKGELLAEMSAGPGSLLGLPAVVGNNAYSLTAEVKKGAKVSFVAREEFSRLMLTEPNLAVMILRVLAAEVRSARTASVNHSELPPVSRRRPTNAGIPQTAASGAKPRHDYIA